MGHRAWFSRVGSLEKAEELLGQIDPDNNPDSYGGNYGVRITREGWLSEGVWRAWSGDGSGSADGVTFPTVLLDNVGSEDPCEYGEVWDREQMLDRKSWGGAA